MSHSLETCDDHINSPLKSRASHAGSTNVTPRDSPNKENYLPRHSLSMSTASKAGITSLSPVKAGKHTYESPRKQALQSFSPRKHIAQNKEVSFTPCRTQLPPRAWERVATKPFAARSEGQKIWKRVPLQEIGHDANLLGMESRRDREAKQDYLRAVKRMKVDSAEDPNKDAWNADLDVERSCFWATRFEEENIEAGGSPKKKVRLQQAVLTPADENHQYPEDKAPAVDKIEGAETRHLESEFKVSASNNEENGVHPDAMSASNVVHAKQLSDQAERDTTPTSIPNQPKQTLMHTSEEALGVDTHDTLVQANEIEAATKPCDVTDNDKITPEENNSDDAVSQAKDEAHRPTQLASNMLQAELESDIANQPNISTVISVNGKPHADIEALGSAANRPECTSLQPVYSDFLLNTDVNPSDACADLFDLSVPATLKHVDPIPAANVNDTNEGITSGDILASMPSPDASKILPTKPTSMYVNLEQEEDTAFLADFILRAKASKAAREAATTQQPDNGIQSPKQQTTLVEERKLECPTATDDEYTSDGVQDRDDTASMPSEQTVEASASSPLRRSTRAANTRLPRPQTLPPVPQFGPVLPSQNVSLPNTIQLKRATGNEFVFNAKPQQTVQMMTRTNTKRNQGNAVHVDVRLQQLKKNDTNIAVDKTSQVNSSPTKKRKRARDEDSRSLRMSKKNVKWQEELVSYREATPTALESSAPTCDDFAAIEAAAQAEALRSMTESFSMPEAADDEVATHDPEDSHDQDGSGKLKVRRMRKINVGNVNGTPAPKTRSRSQVNTQASVEILPESSAPAVSRSRSGPPAKSKMPVPVPTANVLSTAKPSSSNVTDAERKLDGRRKLRARS